MKLVRFMKSSTDRPAGEARAAAGRQHVVGPGDIIADRFGRVPAEEHAAGVADLREQRLGIVDRQLDVLGGEAIGERRGFGQVRDHDDHAVRRPSSSRATVRGSAASQHLHVDAVRDRVGEQRHRR